MKITVLGGTGLTGPFAVRRLHQLGHEVTVFHRGEHAADLPADVRILRGTLEHPPEELRRPAPDVVIHMWAMTEGAAQSFVAFFRGFAGRAVVISSGDVYRVYGRLLGIEPGEADGVPLGEVAPLRETFYPYRNRLKDDSPEWMRKYDKILVEQAVTGHADFPATILRYPAVYGPGDVYHRFGGWVRQMDSGGNVELEGAYSRWRWTHGYVEDVAHATVLAATDDRAANRIYNVGEAETPSMAERVQEFARIMGWKGRIVPAATPPMPGDFRHHLVVDTGCIRRELGYAEIVNLDEALRRTVEWERK